MMGMWEPSIEPTQWVLFSMLAAISLNLHTDVILDCNGKQVNPNRVVANCGESHKHMAQLYMCTWVPVAYETSYSHLRSLPIHFNPNSHFPSGDLNRSCDKEGQVLTVVSSLTLCNCSGLRLFSHPDHVMTPIVNSGPVSNSKMNPH